MGQAARPERARGLRALVVGMIVLLGGTGVSSGAGTPAVAATTAGGVGQSASGQSTTDAQEVRTVYTGELGVARPAGLAYDPSREEFLVAEDAAAATPVLRLGPDGDRLGAFTLPELTDPETLAFNAGQDELTAIDGADVVQVPDSALDTRRPRTVRAPIDELQLDAPESATFDPQTDTWFVLEEQDDAVAVVQGDDPTTAADPVPLPPSDADRVIAFNPADDLLYVLDENKDRVDAVAPDGDVRRQIDMGSTDLQDPVAMTFAPSTDTTDDPDNLNLYVADAGSPKTLGGVTEVSLAAVSAAAAPTDTATRVRTVDTSKWKPASPDPAGVVWEQRSKELLVVDSEVEETTGAGWNNVNLWRTSRTGSVVGTGAFWGPNAVSNFAKEPTGLSYDASSDTLFVSDDSADKVFVVKRGADGTWGTRDDIVTSIDAAQYGGVDTEDPEFDPVSGDLFYLDGVSMEIYRIDPVDGVFGNGNDAKTQFDISHLGPVDFEGLTSNPQRRTLYVGARTTEQIFEITHDGTLLRIIDAKGITGIRQISGLAVAPASSGGGAMNMWIVDRQIDNGPDPTENDGKMFEISAPNIGATPAPVNDPPEASDDAASTKAAKQVTVSVLANDSDPDGDPLTVTNLTQPANGSVQVSGQAVVYTPDVGFAGTDRFTYTANDGQDDSNRATVTVSVADRSKIVFHRIVYNPRGKDNANLNKEFIVLRNIGSKDRKIHNWLVRDLAGNRYRLPDGFVLRSTRYVRIHSGKGTNDSDDLFWGRSRSVWNNGGDRATLKDRRDRVRDRCRYEGGGRKVRC